MQQKYPQYWHPAKVMFRAGPFESLVTMEQVKVESGVAHLLYSQQGQYRDWPIVIILGGSEGGITSHHSRIGEAVLDKGYSMAGIGYHNFDGTPDNLREIAIEPIVKRIADLSKMDNGRKRCVALIGVSKGAELALLIATKSQVADTVVAVVPSNVIWQASNISLLSRSSWTYNDEPLPFVRYPWLSKGTMTFLSEGVTKARGLHEDALSRLDSEALFQIPVEKISVPVLLQSAKQDNVWPSHEMSLSILERLKAKKAQHKFTLIPYELDHYLTLNKQPVYDAVDFISNTLSSKSHCIDN
ncbi:MAG: hypothetical protein HWD84_09165 [Flavobacteriaceae bacterium]|nr:hypothetical protein [Flavobacteriaceae bacterium]